MDMTITLWRKSVLHYQSEDGKESVRLIVPIEVRTTKDNNKVLVAYCELRNAARSFRVDRIKSLQKLGAVSPCQEV